MNLTPFPGEEAANAAFYISQHAMDDPQFMAYALNQIEAEYRRGQAPARQFALLYDRVQMLAGRPQKYGTQFNRNASGCELWRVAEPTKLAQYRAELGLETIEE